MKRAFTVMCMMILFPLILVSTAVAATRVDSDSANDLKSRSVDPTGIFSQFNEQYAGNVLDNNARTVFSYIHWTGKAADDVPELRFSFNYNDISDIWIRNGNISGYTAYYDNARAKEIDITVASLNGTYTYSYIMDDGYDISSRNSSWNSGYQKCALPSTVYDVFRVDIFIRSCRAGTKEKYNVCVSDILFTTPSKPTYTTSPFIDDGNFYVTLNQRLATRSGPSTNYDELGSYFSAGTEIKAISKAWDTRNDIWWVQVEFAYNGTARRAYTGLKRLNMSAESVPTEKVLSSDAVVRRDCRTAWGPGESYAPHNEVMPAGTRGVIYSIERDYAQFEYFDGKIYHRVWIQKQNLQY